MGLPWVFCGVFPFGIDPSPRPWRRVERVGNGRETSGKTVGRRKGNRWEDWWERMWNEGKVAVCLITTIYYVYIYIYTYKKFSAIHSAVPLYSTIVYVYIEGPGMQGQHVQGKGRTKREYACCAPWPTWLEASPHIWALKISRFSETGWPNAR